MLVFQALTAAQGSLCPSKILASHRNAARQSPSVGHHVHNAQPLPHPESHKGNSLQTPPTSQSSPTARERPRGKSSHNLLCCLLIAHEPLPQSEIDLAQGPVAICLRRKCSPPSTFLTLHAEPLPRAQKPQLTQSPHHFSKAFSIKFLCLSVEKDGLLSLISFSSSSL